MKDARGDAAQAAVTAWLQRSGYLVAPLHAIENGRAPMLEGARCRHALPDLQACGAGHTCWVEVKYKDSPVYFRVADSLRTGVDLPNWDAYLRVEAESGLPGYLAIIHGRAGKDPSFPWAPVLLTASFASLEAFVHRTPQPTAAAPCGMAYWDVERFAPHDMGGDAMARPLALGAGIVRAWERPGRAGTPPPHYEPPRQGLLWPVAPLPLAKKP